LFYFYHVLYLLQRALGVEAVELVPQMDKKKRTGVAVHAMALDVHPTTRRRPAALAFTARQYFSNAREARRELARLGAQGKSVLTALINCLIESTYVDDESPGVPALLVGVGSAVVDRTRAKLRARAVALLERLELGLDETEALCIGSLRADAQALAQRVRAEATWRALAPGALAAEYDAQRDALTSEEEAARGAAAETLRAALDAAGDAPLQARSRAADAPLFVGGVSPPHVFAEFACDVAAMHVRSYAVKAAIAADLGAYVAAAETAAAAAAAAAAGAPRPPAAAADALRSATTEQRVRQWRTYISAWSLEPCVDEARLELIERAVDAEATAGR
jgi:hypothetical protein